MLEESGTAAFGWRDHVSWRSVMQPSQTLSADSSGAIIACNILLFSDAVTCQSGEVFFSGGWRA